MGHATLNFSPYVLSAMPVSGFAIELDKNSKHLSAIAGRIRKASFPDLENTSGPFYPERWCAGLKLGIQKSDLRIQLSGAFAFDRNLDESQITNVPYAPAETGFSMSINLEKKIRNNWQLSIEQAASLNTYLHNEEETTIKNKFYETKPNFAGIYKLSYSKKQERIEQEYKSLCSWYFVAGVENGGVEFNSRIFKQKINISIKSGIQKKIQSLDDLRMLLQLRVNSKILKTGDISLAISNQTNIQRNNPFLRPDEIAIPQDTLYLFAVQKNLQSNLTLPLAKLQNTWFSVVGNYNEGAQLKGIAITSEKQLESSLSTLNMICSVTRKFNAQKNSFSLGANYNQTTNSDRVTYSKGGQLSITQSRKHGDKIMFQCAYFANQTQLIQNRIAWSGSILKTKSKKELIQLQLQTVWQLLVQPVKTQNFLLCATLSLKVL
ncbi:MAG TPA: hypothetical protein PK637_01195 [Flavobacteriales bacterium]|nr:hypothetical protein [Flavobacteriales bacterium]